MKNNENNETKSRPGRHYPGRDFVSLFQLFVKNLIIPKGIIRNNWAIIRN